MMSNANIRKREIFLLVFAAIAVLILPHILRPNDVSFGYDSYYHIRVIEDIKANGLNQKDNLFFGTRDFRLSLLDIILSFFPNTLFLVNILPFATGIISVLLYLNILIKINPGQRYNVYAPFILLSSPIFIYSFTVYNEYFFSYFLILLGSFLFLNEKILLSLIFFIFAPLFNPQCILIVVLAILLLLGHFKGKIHFVSYIITLITIIIFLKEANYSHLIFDVPASNEFISDFGAKIGFGVFGLLLAFCGLIISWKNKKRHILTYFVIIVCGFISLRLDFLKLFIEILISAFSAGALYKISHLNWEYKKLKEYTILLLLCGLIFSSVSQIKKISTDPPFSNEITALKWLNKNSEQNAVILSHYMYGHMIQYVTHRMVIIDKLYYETTEENIRLNNVTDLFQSRNFRTIDRLISNYNITHIYITDEMKKGLVWKKEDEGILLILSAGERFKKVYDFEGIEIYKVKK